MNDNTGTGLGAYTINELLTMLSDDFTLLQLGEWVPDDDSCEASREVVEEIRTRLHGVKS